MTYTVVFVREPDGRYSVHVPAIKGCHTWGEDLPHAIEMAKDAMVCHLQSLELAGDPIPPDLPRVDVELEDGTEALVYRLSVTTAEAVAGVA
jgi:predicted RNase H-like HicB family nuclease